MISPDVLPKRLKPGPQVKFFFAISWAERAYHEELHGLIAESYNSMEPPSPIYCFSDFSHYYDSELGGSVWKYFVALDSLRQADQMVPIKIWTEKIQGRLADREQRPGSRTVNIDPGYLSGWQVVLSTVKNHSHRVYLSRGVYCEVTLRFRHGAFETLPWTYPDYQTDLALGYFLESRQRYRSQLRSELP